MSLCMFFVEVPYKSTSICTENHDSKTQTAFIGDNGQAMTCTYTEAKDPSPFMNWIINANITIGIIFILLSVYAYIRNRKIVKSP